MSDNLFNLNGKRAIVTGSTQGIGFAIAKVLRDHGAEVYLHGAGNLQKVKNAAEILPTNLYLTADLEKSDSISKIYETTGDLDIVVANVSIQIRKPWELVMPEEFEKQVSVNFRSTFQLMQTYIPSMQRKKWGRFIIVGSVQQYRPNPQMPIYAAIKCALQSLVHNIAKQVAQDGVTVNNLVPGVIETPRNETALADEEYAQKVLNSIPAGFFGAPRDCAGAALLLCSDAGRYITGIELPVDGGMKL